MAPVGYVKWMSVGVQSHGECINLDGDVLESGVFLYSSLQAPL